MWLVCDTCCCWWCRRIDDDKGRTHELAQCAVMCMRGILECWLKQADKVEKFKHSQIWKNALHVKFHLVTGDVVTKDEEYEHLQVITWFLCRNLVEVKNT